MGYCNDKYTTNYQGKTMTTTTAERAKRQVLNLRIKAEERSLIDCASKLCGKTRTDFVLEAARHAAEEVLLEQKLLMADPQAFAAFLERLDAPPGTNERLRRTMQTLAPWEQK